MASRKEPNDCDDLRRRPGPQPQSDVFCILVKFANGRTRRKVFDDYNDALDFYNKTINRPDVDDARFWEL